MTTLTLAGASAPNHSSPRSSGKRYDALSLFRRGLDRLAREYRIHQGTRAVMALDDRMLRDIGLTSGGIIAAVRFGRAQPD